MKRIAVLAFAAVVSVGLNSCILSPEKNTPPPPPQAYKDLSGPRDNVLFNLQTAYNARNIDRYDELLDADFIFYFSNSDVTSGNWTAGEYWDRAHEISANRNMFNPAYSNPNVEPVSDIDLSLTYASGDDKWTAITPEDQVKYAGETWYEKVVEYTISVQAGNTTYQGIKKNASFVVRWANVDGKEFWRIISWRDDTGT